MALASAYERAGQLRDARRRIRLWGGFEPDFALPRRLIMEGRLAAALGRRDEALRAYGHYLALMSDAEPSFAAEVERVRAALAGAIETPRTND